MDQAQCYSPSCWAGHSKRDLYLRHHSVKVSSISEENSAIWVLCKMSVTDITLNMFKTKILMYTKPFLTWSTKCAIWINKVAVPNACLQSRHNLINISQWYVRSNLYMLLLSKSFCVLLYLILLCASVSLLHIWALLSELSDPHCAELLKLGLSRWVCLQSLYERGAFSCYMVSVVEL